jgi:SAM-dependent methyltransferase
MDLGCEGISHDGVSQIFQSSGINAANCFAALGFGELEMKYRLLDVLRCPCGAILALSKVQGKTVKSGNSFPAGGCREMCAFRQRRISAECPAPPDCTECYTTEITGGILTCDRGHEWPIVNGIPRFLPKTLEADLKKAQETFSFEWKMFRFGERNWGQDISVRRGLFLKGMNVGPEELKGKTIFDAGCGSGLLSMEMAKTFGMEVFALDLAFGIENAYNHNDSPFVHFVQGSVLEPPFRPGVFDYLYCAGVLVACPDTHDGFLSIIKTLKRGGRCFIWLYHPIDREHHPNDLRKMLFYNWIRKNITSRLPIKLQYVLYLLLMPAFLMKQRIKMLLGTEKSPRTWREKMQSLFDMFSPLYQNRHEEDEALRWYSEEGFSNAAISYQELYGFGARGDYSTPCQPLDTAL